MYHGDIRLGDTIDIKFTTVATTGAPTTLAGTPVVSAYVGNGTTEITAGITLTVDFDGRTGLHNVRVVATSGNGFATATNVQLVITTGTVGGTSVVGYVIGSFSIEARSALMPTTAARTLDVSAGGEAGIDWANIGSPTTAVNLSGTNIDTDQVVASVSGAVGSVTGNVGGNVAGSVGSVTAQVTANVTAISGDSTAADNLEQAFDDAAGPVPWLGISDQGAAQAATGTTVQLRAATPFGANDTPVGQTIAVFGSTQGYWQVETIADYDTATDTATLTNALPVTPTGTITYKIFMTARASGGGGSLTAADVWTYVTRELTANPGLDAAGVRTAVGLAAANLDTQLSGIQSDTDNIQTRIPAALVSGRMDSSVGSMANNVMTAAATAADYVTELQSGLSTLDAAGVRAAVGLAAANLDTQLSTIDTVVDGIATAVADVPTNAEFDARTLPAANYATAAALATVDGLVDQILALLDDPRGEPGQGNPPVNGDLATKIDYLYKAWRNRSTQTASEYALFADDGVTKDQEAACSDDGTTFVRGEVVTGA